MTRYFLTRVSVEGFRGINNDGDPLVLSFKSDRVNSVFAPNGSGKSSLYEALEYAFRGSVARLNQMQSAESPANYIANLFHSQRKATIEVTLAPDDGGSDVKIVVERESSGERTVSSVDVSDPDALLASMNEDFALLDYAAFNRFIEDTALTRGRSFSSLLGLSEYGEFLRTLKAVSNSQTFKSDLEVAQLEAENTSLRARADEALRDFVAHYRTLTAREIDDVSRADRWGDEVLSSLRGVALLSPLLEDCSSLAAVNFAALKNAVFEAESGAVRERLATLTTTRNLLDERVASRAPVDASKDLERRLSEYDEALSAAAESELQGLLSAASEYLHLHEDTSACPLCERPGADGLAERVDERLDALAELKRCEEALRTEVFNGVFVSRLGLLEQGTVPPLDDMSSVAAALRTQVQTGINLTDDDIRSAESRLTTLEGLLALRAESVATALEKIEASLPPSLVHLAELVATAEAARTELTRHIEAKSEADKAQRKLDAITDWKRFIDSSYRTFASAESKMSQRILGELRTDYQEIFAGIMSVGDIVPNLNRANGTEQLTVELSKFHSAESVSARAVLSESYRNALAISVFLSAAARHGRAPRFVVLDDVTSSFDAGHQYRMMEQLRTRLQHDGSNDGLQVILLSHDVTLEKYFDRLDDGQSWHHQKLQGWPPLTPVKSHNQNVDRLRDDAEKHLRAGRTSEGAGLMRQYLEFVLQQVIRKLQIPVPIDLAVNEHAIMVGSCLDAIVDAVKTREKLGTIVLEQQQISDLTGRHVPAIVANWVSHYGSSGSAVFSPPSLLAVLGDIDGIRRCFQYDESGSGNWRFYKSLTKRF
ncbi:AAA domain-containing protein [Paramicrobacterium humi]|uniref:Nuclease SbcCD subunit C n=1 Tax=Paramicrobacterium humi TaxID=640635 RepID=A0A1H4PZL4_9MICO|nr:AAA family ATPase [Microbacterium humi]SEC12688.1 AAA domain-containing protein [Microbacterium humi]